MTQLLREKQSAVRQRPAAALLALLIAIAVVVSIAGSVAASTLTATCGTNGTLDSSAVGGGQSNFEIDAAAVGGTTKKPVFTAGANLTLDGASPCLDWTTAAKGAGNNDSLTTGVIVKADKPSGTGDDSFTQGTDENDTTPTIAAGSIPPNKSDLQDFGIYRESNSSGGKFLDLFWSRVNAPSGTVDMDFELNQNVCDGTAATCSANGSGQFVLPLRSNGDRLITYDLANGGTNPTISIYTWNGTSSSGSWANGQVISGGTHEALGSINFDPIATADGGGLGAKDALTFGEVSVSYKALFGSGGTSGCGSFGSVFLKSRSSNTFTDEMKDFVAPQTVQITNCTTLATTASNATSATAQTIGGTITDTATLSNAQSPTNGVVFKAYGPFDPATDVSADTCNDTGVNANLRYTSNPAIALTPNGAGAYTASVPASGANSFTPAAAGRYEWIASYAADANNGASGGSCRDAGEQSLVAPVTPAIATSASNSTSGTAQSLGSAITDQATLTGTAKQPDGSNAGGTITFKLYGPASTPTCIDSGTGMNLVFTSSTFAVNGDRSGATFYGPASYTPSAAGTYYWIASYSGNPPNTNATAGTCGASGETSVVAPNTPTLSTNADAGSVGVTPGTALSDTAVLGNTALEPDGVTKAQGTITFKLYGPAATATCVDSGAGVNLVGTVTISVNGDGSYKASDGTLQSGTVSPTSPGTYYWTASYSGDLPNTLSKSEGCGGTNESSIVAQLPSTITTAQSWFPNDTATIDHSGGTVVFTLYKNSACITAANVVYGPTGAKSVAGTGAGGTAPYKASTTNWTGSSDAGTVAPFSVTSVTGGDRYYWQAAYTSGDAQHKNVTSCTEATTFTSLDNGSSVTSP